MVKYVPRDNNIHLAIKCYFLCYIKISSSVVRYAREDTHYLLYIYDLMRNELLSKSVDAYDRLLEVFFYSFCRFLLGFLLC
jgi:hypothetical protein